jgi:hypothetical protein
MDLYCVVSVVESWGKPPHTIFRVYAIIRACHSMNTTERIKGESECVYQDGY